jgi:PPM family protein phosphatase
MSSSDEPDTTDFVLVPDNGRVRPEPYSSLVQVDLAGMSHLGRVRQKNEDHFFICRFGRYFETVQTNLPEDSVPARSEEAGYGMVVADGLGGHRGGEEASRLAIRSLVNLVLHTPDWLLRLDEESDQAEVMRRATERYEQVNQVLADEAEANRELSGFATTMTMAYGLGRDLFVAHIGDSRAYLLRQGQLQQLTRDHTLAQKIMDETRIGPKVAAKMRHVLIRCLGDHGNPTQPDVTRFSLEDKDCLLVCTDGLTTMVQENVITDILNSDEGAQTICEQLVDQALKAGGKDNVTVTVARFRLP